jgi:hypothetical protein
MTVVNIDLAWLQAVADFNTRLADLELAIGTALPAADSSAASPRDHSDSHTTEVKP